MVIQISISEGTEPLGFLFVCLFCPSQAIVIEIVIPMFLLDMDATRETPGNFSCSGHTRTCLLATHHNQDR